MRATRKSDCARCGTCIEHSRTVGRPSVYCSSDCRRAVHAEGERARRARRNAEIKRLREIAAMYEAALAA
jgi:hypothetical protein